MPLFKWGKSSFGQSLATLVNEPATTSNTGWTSWFQKQPAPTTTTTASADAIGQNTLASTSTSVKTLDVGPVSITRGTVDATALAQSSDGSTTYASAVTSALYPQGDVMLEQATNTNGSGADASGDWAYASSTTSFMSIDIQGIDFTPRLIQKTTDATVTTKPASFNGNLATFNVDMSASGDNTYADAQVSALTVEDRYSSATTTTVTSAQSYSRLDYFHSLF